MPVQQYTGEMHLFLSIALLLVTVAIALSVILWWRRAKDNSEPEVRKRAAITHLLSDQDAVISSVITEITSRPASYAGFPPEIVTELMRLHDAYPRVTKGRFREDY